MLSRLVQALTKRLVTVLWIFNKSKGLCFSSTFFCTFFAKVPTVGGGDWFASNCVVQLKSLWGSAIQKYSNLATNNESSFTLIFYGQEAKTVVCPLLLWPTEVYIVALEYFHYTLHYKSVKKSIFWLKTVLCPIHVCKFLLNALIDLTSVIKRRKPEDFGADFRPLNVILSKNAIK